MPSSFLAPSTPQDPSYRSDPNGDFLLWCGLPWQKLPLEPFPRFFPRSSRPRVRKNQPPTPTIYCENRNRGWSLPKTSCWFCSSSEPPSLLLLFYLSCFRWAPSMSILLSITCSLLISVSLTEQQALAWFLSRSLLRFVWELKGREWPCLHSLLISTLNEWNSATSRTVHARFFFSEITGQKTSLQRTITFVPSLCTFHAQQQLFCCSFLLSRS